MQGPAACHGQTQQASTRRRCQERKDTSKNGACCVGCPNTPYAPGKNFQALHYPPHCTAHTPPDPTALRVVNHLVFGACTERTPLAGLHAAAGKNPRAGLGSLQGPAARHGRFQSAAVAAWRGAQQASCTCRRSNTRRSCHEREGGSNVATSADRCSRGG